MAEEGSARGREMHGCRGNRKEKTRGAGEEKGRVGGWLGEGERRKGDEEEHWLPSE